MLQLEDFLNILKRCGQRKDRSSATYSATLHVGTIGRVALCERRTLDMSAFEMQFWSPEGASHLGGFSRRLVFYTVHNDIILVKVQVLAVRDFTETGTSTSV
jgi:hypothetical protein